MAGEGIQHYLDLMNGLRQATRERATATARGWLAQAGLEDAADAAGERLTRLTDELQAAGKANRELMLKLVGAEVEKVADQLGFVRREDLDELQREIAELRVGLAHQVVRTEEAMAMVESLADDAMAEGLGIGLDDDPVPGVVPAAPAEVVTESRGPVTTTAPATGGKTTATKATGTKAAEKATAKKAAARTATARTATARTATAKTAAKKATAKKSTAKKSTAEKVAAKKAAGKTAVKRSTAEKAASTRSTSATPAAPEARP